MRSAKLISVLGLILLASFSFIVVGCGSDDSPTSSPGSLTDPEFVAFQSQVESFVDSTLGNVLTGLGSMGSISSGGSVDPILYGPVFPDSDFVTISYAEGWHVVNLTKSRTNYAFNIIDSVQFYANDLVSQTGAAIDSMWYRHHWTFDVADTSATHFTTNGFSGFDFRGLQSDLAVIDGAHVWEVNVKHVTVDSTVWVDYGFDADITNLVVARAPGGWEQACPQSGTISASVETIYAKDDATPVLSTWTVTMTFNSGSVLVVAQKGSTVWTYSHDVCNTPS